jgi:hypothetical protein
VGSPSIELSFESIQQAEAQIEFANETGQIFWAEFETKTKESTQVSLKERMTRFPRKAKWLKLRLSSPIDISLPKAFPFGQWIQLPSPVPSQCAVCPYLDKNSELRIQVLDRNIYSIRKPTSTERTWIELANDLPLPIIFDIRAVDPSIPKPPSPRRREPSSPQGPGKVKVVVYIHKAAWTHQVWISMP